MASVIKETLSLIAARNFICATAMASRVGFIYPVRIWSSLLCLSLLWYQFISDLSSFSRVGRFNSNVPRNRTLAPGFAGWFTHVVRKSPVSLTKSAAL